MADELVGAFAVLYEDTVRRCDQALDDLHSLRQGFGGGFEDRSYLDFVEALELMFQTVRARLDSLNRYFQRETAGGSATETARSMYDNVRTVAEAMTDRLEAQIQLLRMPRSAELEVFAEPMARLAKRLVPNAEVLFFPWVGLGGYRLQAFDGAYVQPVAALLAENLRRAFGPDIQFLRLRHPAPRRADLFQHAVFAHEVAHAAIDSTVPQSVRARLRARDRKAGLPSPEGGRRLITPTYRTIAFDYADTTNPDAGDPTRLRNWAREMACDMVAFRLMGPAFLVAYCEVTAVNRTIEGPKEAPEHPPPSLRFKLLASETARFAFGPVESEVRAVMDHYLASHRGTSSATVTPLEDKWVFAALQRFEETLPSLLGALEFTPLMLQRDLPEILRLADANIPPSERLVALASSVSAEAPHDGGGDAVREARNRREPWSVEFDWRSIINGVLCRLLRDHGPPVVEGSPERDTAREEAVRHALAGIELSEFQRKARALQEQYMDLYLEPAGRQ